MFDLAIKIKKVTIVRGVVGTDKISFNIEAPSSFPNMGYEPYFTIETQAGYAEAWLESIGLTHGRLTNSPGISTGEIYLGEHGSAEFELIELI